MKRLILNNIFILSLIFLMSCKKDKVEGIILGNTLLVHQDYSKNRKMVNLIKSSLNKDSKAFKQLIHFPTGGGASSYDLGYVISQLIYQIGETETIKIIENYNYRNLNNLEGMINLGLEYGDNDYDGKMDETYFKDEFPKLFKCINEKIKTRY